MKSIAHIALIAATVLVVGTSHLHADDWPHWMGPKRDGVWYESGTIDQFPADGARVLWRHKIGGGYAGPAVANGRVFVMDRIDDKGAGIKSENGNKQGIAGGERIVCLDVKTGNEIWTHEYESQYTILYPTGPRCTPTVDGEYVYTLGAMGDLKCLKVENGDLVWQKKLTEEYKTKPPLWGYASHPYVDGENLIVPTGGDTSGIVAFNKTTGKEIWRAITTSDIGYSPIIIHEPTHDAPTTDASSVNTKRQLIFWHGEGISSLSPDDGTEYWSCQFPEEKNPSVVTIATPVLTSNKLLIAEFYKGSMLLQINSNPPGFKEIWRDAKKKPKPRDAMNAMITTPIIKDDLAYGVGYAGRGLGVLRCIDLATGDMKWTEDTWIGDKPLMFASGFITPNADKHFLFNDIGELIICRLGPDGFKELDRAKLLEPTSVARGRDVLWSHPAYANGNLFARNDKEIICVSLKK